MSDDLSAMYQELILDHSRRRVGQRTLEAADASHHELNPTCGDEITLQVTAGAATGAVGELAWHGNGCSISMASASILAELAADRPGTDLRPLIDEFRTMMHSRGRGEPDDSALGDAVVFHGTSKYVMRVKCAMLAWVALEKCLDALPAGPAATADA
ncbi:Fe-S cluster assembly sulfur transfer protein SufU [Marisediminicola senii]|uniref:Fe-S cluster assembly sulfur transfer protein SufU n=1 Tax=Marisediminicola senii TaxID=2711233 RepID=UPI0013EC74BE|nr:SUF system NifU family Fe-S cluster assembly protein [Marisediminicola senii]